jgi:hypothetical protein
MPKVTHPSQEPALFAFSTGPHCLTALRRQASPSSFVADVQTPAGWRRSGAEASHEVFTMSKPVQRSVTRRGDSPGSRLRRRLVAVAALLLAGCQDPAGPDPQVAALTGPWRLRACVITENGGAGRSTPCTYADSLIVFASGRFDIAYSLLAGAAPASDFSATGYFKAAEASTLLALVSGSLTYTVTVASDSLMEWSAKVDSQSGNSVGTVSVTHHLTWGRDD